MKSYIYTFANNKITVYRVRHNVPKQIGRTGLLHRDELQAVTATITSAERLKFSEKEEKEIGDKFSSWLGNRSCVCYRSGFTQNVAAYRYEKGRIQINRVM